MIMINIYFVERPCHGKCIKNVFNYENRQYNADNIMIHVFGKIVFISITVPSLSKFKIKVYESKCSDNR